MSRIALHAPRTHAPLLVLAALALGACDDRSSQASDAEASASTTPSAAPTLPPATASAKGPGKKVWLNNAPAYPLLPGKGFGPIRFGATVATIERHMYRKCDVLKKDLCRMWAPGLEFHLKDGKLIRIHAHRLNRPAGKDPRGVPLKYGAFRGAVPPDVYLGMHVEGAQMTLGAPLRVEKVKEPGPANTVERHYYGGMIAEYDDVAEARVPVLSGVQIFPTAAGETAWDPEVDGKANQAKHRGVAPARRRPATGGK